MGVQRGVGVALVVFAVVDLHVVAPAPVVGGVGDDAVGHGVDLGAAGRGKVGAAVAAAAKRAGNVLIARQRRAEVERAGHGRLAVLADLRIEVSVQFGGSLVQLVAGFGSRGFQGILPRVSLRDRIVLLLDADGQLAVLAFQLGVLAVQLGLVGLQLSFGVFQLGALLFQRHALGLDVVADLLVPAGHLVQRIGKGQQLIEVGRGGQQRDGTAVVEFLHGAQAVFEALAPGVILGLFLVDFRLLGRDLLLFGIDLALGTADEFRQGADLAEDEIGLLLILGLEFLGVFAVGGVLADLLVEGVQLLLRFVFLGLQLRALIVGRQRRRCGGDRQRDGHRDRQQRGDRLFYKRRKFHSPAFFLYTFRCLRMLVAVPMPHSTKPSSAKPPAM